MDNRLQQLIKQLENLVVKETEDSDSPWIKGSRLEQLFNQKNGSTIENVLQTHGYYDLKTLLRKSHIFAIYESPIPKEFYIALLRKTVSGSQKSSIGNQPMFYTVKRPWKVEQSMIKELQDDGYLPTPNPIHKLYLTQTNLPYTPKYPAKIISQDDLKCTLVEIVKTLSGKKIENYVTIDELNNPFYKNYGQNLRDVRRKIFPDLNLVDLLQTIPEIKLEKIQDTWRITLNIS
ncbi:OST-HTH/LOTUS domain-containing protein [Planktothrix sp. FACHB-1365]|uniref:OST-HTH/LOTUS domain-containing protein n=1 Tax=Planktothrix sp. FACHB-1365 TaxID=2692855 RepID=UPI00168632ED|nr:OST-HTH/LOTUS domain-containing protein [Planktothrix sp. FACHB-1365]MBD2484624.1 hypothetical protein [Planktothrix sp. FACHB-1365]